MGIGCSVDGNDSFEPFQDTGGRVHVLIVCLDYKYSPGHELTATRDGEAMRRIAHRADAASITVVNDHQDLKDRRFPTRTVVLSHIKQVASRCREGDWFVWFFAGHGVNVPDASSDEVDGLDEAFVTPDAGGALSEKGVLLDDVFAKALDTFVPQGVRILCICDCCHSGTICDIDSYRYRHDIYQLSASLDAQEAEDTGRGGMLTYVLMKILLELGFKAWATGRKEFTLHTVLQSCKQKLKKITTEQEVSIAWSGEDPRSLAWPLCFPVWRYADIIPKDLADAPPDS